MSTQSNPAAIPADFSVLKLRANPFIDPLGPLYGKREQIDQNPSLVMGVMIEARHCNPGGTCHGGMLMTMSDMLLLLNANAQTGIAQFMVTVNLTCDFVGPAREGDWIEGRATVVRATRNMIFVNGVFTSGENAIARTNGIFKPTGEPNPAFAANSFL